MTANPNACLPPMPAALSSAPVPTLHFKGKPLVQNHHLVVPFCELQAVKSRGLSKAPGLHDNLIIEGDNLKALLPTYHRTNR
jgi:hypothetical protein